MSPNVNTTIEVRQNLIITARERGKIVDRREGHNIWLRTGGEWLARLVSLKSFSPDVPEADSRIKYMGLGVGGTRQLAVAKLSESPLTSYPGTNTQTDLNPAVVQLERPVRISGGVSTYPGQSGDIWVAAVQAPPEYPNAYTVQYRRIFTRADVSYGGYTSVPTSEIGLFTNEAVPGYHLNVPVAYDTFDTVSKTPAITLEVVWNLEF